MKTGWYCLALAALVGVGGAQAIQADTVSCLSSISPCNQSGARAYYYEVTADSSLTTLHVGTFDGKLADYSNWVMPNGWTVSVVGNLTLLGHLNYTAHGLFTTLEDYCPYQIVWSCEENALSAGTYYFGFDNELSPVDVSWYTNNSACNCSAVVALGEGPVHAPMPEPGTLVMLVAALIGCIGWLARRKT